MSKSQVFFRVGLWFFLFTLIGSIIFAYLQGGHPGNFEANLFYATTLGFISSAAITVVYAYYHPATQNTPAEPEPAIPHGNYSGRLTDWDGLPSGFIIIYDRAWQEPVISSVNSNSFQTPLPPGTRFVWTVVKFGNAKIIIEAQSRQITVTDLKDINIVVKDGSDSKFIFGF